MAEIRVDIGFNGGGSTAAILDEPQWQQLQDAVTSNSGDWVTVNGKDDEQLVLNTSQVVYVRVHSVLRTVGFAGIS